MIVVVALHKGGKEYARININEDDATTQEVARAAISLIESCMSMQEGDKVTVTQANGRVHKR